MIAMSLPTDRPRTSYYITCGSFRNSTGCSMSEYVKEKIVTL